MAPTCPEQREMRQNQTDVRFSIAKMRNWSEYNEAFKPLLRARFVHVYYCRNAMPHSARMQATSTSCASERLEKAHKIYSPKSQHLHANHRTQWLWSQDSVLRTARTSSNGGSGELTNNALQSIKKILYGFVVVAAWKSTFCSCYKSFT